MPSSDFAVGDRVRMVGDQVMDSNIFDKLGTITKIEGRHAAVEFDEDIGGHDCNGYFYGSPRLCVMCCIYWISFLRGLYILKGILR